MVESGSEHMATSPKSIKKAIESKRDKLFEKWYDREINIYVIYDRVHNKKHYSTSQKYEWDIGTLFKKYPELKSVDLYSVHGNYLDGKNLRFYSGVAIRTKITRLPEIITRHIGKGTLEDFYRFIDSI